MAKITAASNRRQQQKADSRERVVKAAAQLFRERGTNGAGIADIMKAADLTHGGFYAHFQNKEELLAAAITQAMTQKRSDWFSDLADLSPEDQLKRVSRRYLSKKHRDLKAEGCALAALGTDLAQAGVVPQEAMADELCKARNRLAGLMDNAPATATTLAPDEVDSPDVDRHLQDPPDPSAHSRSHEAPQAPHPENQERALALFALYVGGIVVSRAVGDSQLSDEIIEACRHLADREVGQILADTSPPDTGASAAHPFSPNQQEA